MCKPVFGKWTRVEDGLPSLEDEGKQYDARYVLAKKGEKGIPYKVCYDCCGKWSVYGIEQKIEDLPTHWMLLPKAGEDAFAELRAKIAELEGLALDCGGERSEGVLYTVNKIREVIGE